MSYIVDRVKGFVDWYLTPPGVDPKDYQCSICMEIPEQTKEFCTPFCCGQPFCLDCLAQAQAIDPKCPTCRQELPQVLIKGRSYPDPVEGSPRGCRILRTHESTVDEVRLHSPRDVAADGVSEETVKHAANKLIGWAAYRSYRKRQISFVKKVATVAVAILAVTGLSMMPTHTSELPPCGYQPSTTCSADSSFLLFFDLRAEKAANSLKARYAAKEGEGEYFGRKWSESQSDLGQHPYLNECR